MNKWIERAIFINLIFFIIYVGSDYAMWMRIPADMEGISFSVGTFENLRVETSYNVLIKFIEVAGDYRTSTLFRSVAYISGLPNFPLIIFFFMILINILLMRAAIRKSI
jgi:hypothetical protein